MYSETVSKIKLIKINYNNDDIVKMMQYNFIIIMHKKQYLFYQLSEKVTNLNKNN